MTVVFLITDLKRGGGQAQLLDVASRLRARGWDVRAVSMVPPVALTDEFAAAGVPLEDLGMRLGVPDPRGLLRLVWRLRRWRPDVLHCHLVHANLLGRLARLFVHVPVLISTAHNVDEGSRRRERAYRRTDRLSDLTTQVCRAGAERYVEIGAARAERMEVVHNGIDLGRYRPRTGSRPPGPFRWLAVGRLDPQKDHATLLRAFARLVADGRYAHLRVVGTGPLQGDLEALAGELGIGDQVELLGPRPDVPELLRSADAFVSSSAWEGLPLVLLEAAAAELPIVATDVGGTDEIVDDGENGFLCEPRDPDALAEGMARVMDLDRAERARLGAAGRRRVELDFDLERVVDRWEEIYRDLLSRRR